MKISLAVPDDRMPRTLFFERLLGALRANPRFTENEGEADLLFPEEDVCVEQHWPRYGDQHGCYVRGSGFDPQRYGAYLERLGAEKYRRLCIINMHPQFRVPQAFKDHANVIVADANLHAWERALKPRTIAVPALPITPASSAAVPRTILASFRGVMSHPVRQELARLHDGRSFVCEIVDPGNHVGRVDALGGGVDERYVDLMQRSVFGLVPRGDAMYSYRLLEVMSFGCIPVVLSDGWVLPFDRAIPWHELAVVMPEAEAIHLRAVLESFSLTRIREMMEEVALVYRTRLASLDLIVESLLEEVEQLSAPAPSENLTAPP